MLPVMRLYSSSAKSEKPVFHLAFDIELEDVFEEAFISEVVVLLEIVESEVWSESVCVAS